MIPAMATTANKAVLLLPLEAWQRPPDIIPALPPAAVHGVPSATPAGILVIPGMLVIPGAVIKGVEAPGPTPPAAVMAF